MELLQFQLLKDNFSSNSYYNVMWWTGKTKQNYIGLFKSCACFAGCIDYQKSCMIMHQNTDQYAAAVRTKKMAKQLESGVKKIEPKASGVLTPQLCTVYLMVKEHLPLSIFPKLMVLQSSNGAYITSYYKGHKEISSNDIRNIGLPAELVYKLK